MGRNSPGIQRSLGQRIPPAGTALAGVAAKGADTLTPADLAQTLRNATREAHHSLDHHPLLAPLVRRDLNEKAYANALAALSAPHQWVEQMLGGFAPNPPFTPRWPRLCMDLQWLGRPSLPLGATPPPLVSPAEKLGALYVLEGSRLGAAAIARVIARNLPDKVPTHFFSPASADDQWALFWEFAAERLDVHQVQGMVDGAVDTFGFFLAHLNACDQAKGASESETR